MMTSARSSNSLPRRVTKPRSPGPAPTRKHFPLLLMLLLDLPEDTRRQVLRVVPPPHRHFSSRSIAENLRAQFQLAIHKLSVHAYRQIAITLQQSQEFTLGP